MWISYAYAAPAAGGGESIFGLLFPLVLIMGVFWFLLIRPQQKRAREHREMLKNLRRGDSVVTSGGIIGKIARIVDETEVLVDVAEGTKIRMQKGAIATVRIKGDPADGPAPAKITNDKKEKPTKNTD